MYNLLWLTHNLVLVPASRCLACSPQVEEYADEVFGLLNDGAHMYFCGLKGMMPGILEMLERVAKSKGLNFEEFVEKLKHNNQWHVEVRFMLLMRVQFMVVQLLVSCKHVLCWSGCAAVWCGFSAAGGG